MTPNPNTTACDAIVAALAASGVQHACITPGSRSTPLTVAFAQNRAIKSWLHLDERSSAFFALGLARATGKPVALVCTSGTAASNYHPAVVEANHSRIPLIVCTADRPQRLRDVGADQTMDQVRMFGPNVRWAMDLALPAFSGPARHYFEGVAIRAFNASLAPLPGPVHLNIPFEEPLLGAPDEPREERLMPAPMFADVPAPPPASAELGPALQALQNARKPLLIAGPESGGLAAGPIVDLAQRIGAPILADPLSGLRIGEHDLSHVLDSYDAMLRDRRWSTLEPDAIIRFGGVPTSKALNQALAGLQGTTHVLCDRWMSWRDPEQVATHVVHGDPSLIATEMANRLSPLPDGSWLEEWKARNRRARNAMQSASMSFEDLFEGRLFAEIQASAAPGTTLLVGNSMPVRDADSFLISAPQRLSVVGNRGVNGIDGVNSTALGAAAGGRAPVILVIGDISFYHDLNGLWAARRHRLDLTIVLVNNNGGGIFHYLPQASHDDIFEEWFGTPPDLDFAPVVEMYGGTFEKAEDWAQFAANMAAPSGGLRVIELRTDRSRNTAMHREAWAAAAEAAWGVPVAVAP
ncbi:MAG: 2-succinyl-5-enolpyruvyl-6-hydroxy-3-cyclohexene-1-carboxylic-acid synthase [Dehalococcoidia bacterium]